MQNVASLVLHFDPEPALEERRSVTSRARLGVRHIWTVTQDPWQPATLDRQDPSQSIAQHRFTRTPQRPDPTQSMTTSVQILKRQKLIRIG